MMKTKALERLLGPGTRWHLPRPEQGSETTHVPQGPSGLECSVCHLTSQDFILQAQELYKR